MDYKVQLQDRFRRSFDPRTREAVGRQIALFLSPRTPEELEQRRAHLTALLLVAVIATAKHVTGLTDGSASYTLYVLAVAISAFVGGVAPAAVATMAAVLLADAGAAAGSQPAARVLFVLEAIAVAALVGVTSSRLREATIQLGTARGATDELHRQVRGGLIARDALEHLEQVATDNAVFVVNAQGLVVEWSRSAERMYGYHAEQTLGSPVATLFGEVGAAVAVQEVLSSNRQQAVAQHTGVHRRADGSRVHVEFEVRPCALPDAEHFTIVVHDLSRRRETEAFRDAAERAQTALQQAADEARDQLATLEALTDPAVNPAGGTGLISELLDRLRAGVHADGVALVQTGRSATRVVAVAGLRAISARGGGGQANGGTADGRVVLVHNDGARVAQVSALSWPATVSSIVIVPVCQMGSVAFRMEIVNERRARATEWDLALGRVVADRLAHAMAIHTPVDSADAVA
jgi:PAS domain S-box-containing protein